jgi:putative spermidine/putrescine transport system permease protein
MKAIAEMPNERVAAQSPDAEPKFFMSGMSMRILRRGHRRVVTAGSDSRLDHRWGLYLLPACLLVAVLMLLSQGPFLYLSLFRDLRLGRVGQDLTFDNYRRFVVDPFYVNAAITTLRLSGIVTVLTLVTGFPVAYTLARMQSRWSLLLVASIVTTSFITVIVKVLGLMIIFSPHSGLNRLLLALHVVKAPINIIGQTSGVVIGLLHFTIGFAIMLLYAVIRTIPRSLEEAAQIHGSSRIRVFQRVIIPLAAPGMVSAGLVVFNLCMGAFTATALLGGGNIFTLPLLIDQVVILQTKYATGAAISGVLLGMTLLVNLLSVLVTKWMRATRGVEA